MSEMVERVAKAIEAAGLAYLKGQDDKTGWADVPDELFARAAIAAMREPTPMMRDAACDVGPDTNNGCFSYDNADIVYQAMIDEALK